MSNTTYLVTARKYRPLLFKDVVAQEHVTETLKNAIRLDRLAHAYLFTGPRGVGKTTAARIVAKAINCSTPPEDREDRAEPCRECVSCKTFEEGRNLNIIEIDAASNNKVDDVRDLREVVRIPPQNGRMKVYIIDEVHMLSNAAFNALLKTLEEPPPHAMFIFATTEPHKVLPTIQSRCQRFDFRRISIQEIIGRLKYVCETESITADDASLMLIARKGDGSLRDALSVFDQAVSLCGTAIQHRELITALGVVDTDLYFDVTAAVMSADSAAMIHIVDRIVRAGYDLQEFVDGLAEHLRNFLVALTVDDPHFIEATEEDRERIREKSSDFSESTLMSMIHIASELSASLRLARQPRLRLEMALLRMASFPSSVDIRSALDKLDKLEKMAAAGEIRFVTERPSPVTPAPPVPAPVPTSTPTAAPAKNPAPEADSVVAPSATDETVAASDPGLVDEPVAASEPGSVDEPVAASNSGSVDEPVAASDSGLVDEPVAASEPGPETESESEPESSFPKGAETAETDTPTEPMPEVASIELSPALVPEERLDPLPAPELAQPLPPTTSDAPAADDGLSLFAEAPAIKNIRARPENEASLQVDEDVLVLEPESEDESLTDDGLAELKAAWETLVIDIMASEKQLGSFLKHAVVFAFEKKTILLSVPDEFHAKALRNDRAKLAHRLTELSGSHVERIAFRIEAPASEERPEDLSESSAKKILEQIYDDHPTVRSLMERFGGELVW